ncbi:type VI secretion system-associated protein TagF [Neisseria zalophi]|uniref:Type VI secretion system-associated protein TagF n=1 Tax=Neisseria zalophi TaxID=640030 RepID=A0A5J6PYE1_9NEIS|nr:type VI secretion system-associated protein TagF [Neisseria zalophi]QEY26143.1 type VI secretion system-associated protein TagF [Neisseria zalophi]
MSREEVYFFGKLSKSRDFIVSNNLEVDDKFFLDEWFGRCVGQNKLIPFAKKILAGSKIWLFVIKHSSYENNVYIGLAALSLDKSGREYPFVLFCKSEFQNQSALLEKVEFISSKIDFFQNILNDGQCVLEDSFYNIDVEKDKKDEIGLKLVGNIAKYLSERDGDIDSFWLESNGAHFIEHQGSLSCSLFNKLFGS